MPRREPTRTRRPAVRDPRRTILIVVGADKTEVAYLKGLRNALKAATVALTITAKPGAPDQLVAYARDNCARDDFDEVWCVTDVDHYEREGGKVTAAVAMAATAGINLAVSNPCFELWLLLHHDGCSGYCANCEVVAKKLKATLATYDKTNLRYQDFADQRDVAMKRARRLDPTGKDHGRNPSTNVWSLVEAILEQS